MTIDIYVMTSSPPCRAVLMTAKYLDISLNHKLLDYFATDHLKPDFVKINPQHCVPTIIDNGFILWESRAIMAYFVNQYALDSTLYPLDPKERALVDRMLHFDLSKLYAATLPFIEPQLYGKAPDPELENAFKKALAIFEEILAKSPYSAGKTITLADLSIFAGLTFAELVDYNFDAYPKVSGWMQKLKREIPCHEEINEEDLKKAKEFLKNMKF